MECKMCGSVINPGDTICRTCGSSVLNQNMINNNQNNNIRRMVNNNINPNNIKPNDFVCPHCGIRIPENQLYQFIQRTEPIPTNTIQFLNNNPNTVIPNFNNMSGIVNNNSYNDFPNNNGEF